MNQCKRCNGEIIDSQKKWYHIDGCEHFSERDCVKSLRQRLAAAEADARRWRYVRDNSTLAGETQDGVYLWEWEALDMNPDSIEADVDASIEARRVDMNDHECKPVEMSVESYIETALTEWYGTRCNEHDDPARFAAWAEYDELLRNVQSADAERKQWDHNYATYCQTIADLEQRLAAAEARIKQADKLAYEIALAILNREHGERSAVSDSLLNYLNIGGIEGPPTVPEWMEQYRAAKGGRDE